MTIENGYATLEEFKAELYQFNSNAQADSANDAAMENVITGVSRWIDANRGRRFYAAEETRIYSACYASMIEIDDLVSLTSLKTDPSGDGSFPNTWATTDYRLAPYNAAVNGEPYTWIEARWGGAYSFPGGVGGYDPVINYNYDSRRPAQPLVQVTGLFGYSADPLPAIKQACILASMRVWSRRNLIFGLSGSGELGTQTAITKLGNDGEIMALLSTVKKKVVV